MDKKSYEVMLRLYLDPDFKDGEITKEYLNKSGIDAEAFKQKMLMIINKKRRDDYIKALKNEEADATLYEDNLQFTFRKLEKLDKEDISDIEKDKLKMEILKKLVEKNKTNQNLTEETSE
jgi:hypothetical protein